MQRSQSIIHEIQVLLRLKSYEIGNSKTEEDDDAA